MSLPITAEYPVRRILRYGASVNRFLDGSQQNYQTYQPLNDISLQLSHLSPSQRNTVMSAYNSAKGRYTSNLSLSLGSNSYTNLYFDSDQLSSTESSPLDLSMEISLKQSLPQTPLTNSSPPSSWSAYPTLESQYELPYKPSYNFNTSISVLESGPTYAYSFLSSELPIFYLSYPSISDNDITTLEQFFNYQNGPVGYFSFTDPDTVYGTPVVFTKAHFLNSSLEISYNDAGQTSTTVVIEITN